MGKYNVSLYGLQGAADVALNLGAGHMQPVRAVNSETENKGLIIPVQGIIMDELGKWFMDVFTSVNRGGRLGPPTASCKRVKSFLEQVGGERVLQLATLLNIGNAEAVRELATNKPDLGELLAGDEPQKYLDSYFEERTDYFGPCRKFFTHGLSLPAGNIELKFIEFGEPGAVGSEAWEKVFQILVGRESNDKESSDL